MSETIHEKAIKEVLQELRGEPDNLLPFVDKLIDNYLQDSSGKLQLLVKSGEKIEGLVEYLLQLRGNTMDTVIEGLLKSSEFKDSLYKKSYERLKALVNEGTTWGDLFTREIYSDEQYLNEIFVRLVEEKHGVAITSAKQLQELTGIKEVYGYLDEEKGETIPYGDKKPTKKEAKEIAFNQVEDTFIKAMNWRYSKALQDILNAGGKYNDLLKVKPKYFYLPETWSGCFASDQDSSILWAIEEAFSIGEPAALKPDLKAIAREIEAPYSVLMEVHKLCNKWKLQS
jgi:hypothetical protein